MAVENIELVDREYGNCSKKAMPRQIKTRKTSFANIVERFRQFRIRRLERKMAKIVDKTLSDDYKEKRISSKLMAKSKKLAKLEEKIKLLSREEVPSNFVKSRAIKLRNYMMENAERSAYGLYFVDLDDEDVLNFVANGEVEINNPVSVESADAPEDVSGDDSIDLSSEVIDRNTITDSINSEFNNLENGDKSKNEAISKESLSDSINGELSTLDNNSELKEDGINRDSVSESVNSLLDDINISDSVDSVITPETGIDNSGVVSTETSDNAFSDGDDSNSESIDVVIPETAITNPGNNDTIILNDINKDSVEEVINGALSDLEDSAVSENVDESATFVSPEEVDMVVNPSNEQGVDEAVQDVNEQAASEISVDNPVESVNDAFDESVNSDQIKKYMDEAYDRVSHSGAFAVNTDRYDENGGIRFKYSYTPMTDAEIEESRRRIGSLKDYNPELTITDISDIFVPVEDPSISIEAVQEKRDTPVIVEPRSEEVGAEEDITDYTFDTDDLDTDTKSGDNEDDAIIEVGSRQAKISEYSMLRDRILQLREKQSSVDRDRREVQTSAERIAREAEEAKAKAARSAAVLEDKVQQMKAYCEGLEKACDETIKETSQLKDDIRNNTSFIEAQEDQFDQNRRMINEIDQLIGADEESHSISK